MAKTLAEKNFEDLEVCGEEQVFIEECEPCDDCVSRGLDAIIESLRDIKNSVINLYYELNNRIDILEEKIYHFNQEIRDIWIYISKLKNGLPKGGYTGQVLTKDSDYDYDCSWHTLPCPFPIGSIYMNIVNIDPHNYWLDSWWVRVSEGRTIVGVTNNHPWFIRPEQTGGDYDAQTIEHNHGFTDSTIVENGEHDHKGRAFGGGEAKDDMNFVLTNDPLSEQPLTYVSSAEDASYSTLSNIIKIDVGHDIARTAHTTFVDGKHIHDAINGEVWYEGIDGTNENIQPYYTTYIWKRVPKEEYEEWQASQNKKQKKSTEKK